MRLPQKTEINLPDEINYLNEINESEMLWVP